MKNTKVLVMASTLAIMMGVSTPSWAGEMTCADYDKPDVYSSCKQEDASLTAFEAAAGIGNCCAGLASWKAACDLYHVHADSHSGASNMLKSNRAQHEWNKDYKACLA
jgi:hypothetical protein